MPLPVPITLVVGQPLLVEKVEEPTDEQVAELHRRYCSALVELYQRFRGQFGGAEELCIF